MTGLYPWLGYRLTDRVSVWGVTGYGAGSLLLTPQGGPSLEGDLSMKMFAGGTRGELVSGGSNGFGLAFKADALWVGTATDGVDGPTGRMAATEAAVSRVRTALEHWGTRTVVYADARREERPVTDITIEIGDLATRTEAIVGPAGSEILIGQSGARSARPHRRLQLLCGTCNRAKGTGTQTELVAKLKERGRLAA